MSAVSAVDEGEAAHPDEGSSHAEQADGDLTAPSFDGVPAADLRSMLGVPSIHVYSVVGSTLDVAHRIGASGEPEGSLVLADRQLRGRGRSGRRWSSPPGTGLWLTLLRRPATVESIGVLTVRLGLAAAGALERFADEPIRSKWPNDLYLGGRKLAGILVEARWRGPSPEWMAIGVGVNVTAPPDEAGAAALAPGTERVAVLTVLVPALRAAAAHPSVVLELDELIEYERRDLARGRPCTEPARGTVQGITPNAELVISTREGNVTVNSGSLVLAEDS